MHKAADGRLAEIFVVSLGAAQHGVGWRCGAAAVVFCRNAVYPEW